jgi:hypothetical protein
MDSNTLWWIVLIAIAFLGGIHLGWEAKTYALRQFRNGVIADLTRVFEYILELEKQLDIKREKTPNLEKVE